MRRGARLTKTGLVCVLGLGGVMAADAAAATGDLTQKPGMAGCWSAVGSCSPASALVAARSVTVSPDGRSVYAAAQTSGAVAVFARAADGALTQAGCVSENGAGPCVDGTALDAARSVTVSPDGRNAYVAGGAGGAVAVFDRGADGTLTQKPGAAACISDAGAAPCVDGSALAGAFEVTVSPDGRNAYVASLTSGAVAVFARAVDGTLTQTGCVSDSGAGPCADGTALAGALGVTVSPDGKNAYVASSSSNAVAVFARAADGALTQTGCVSDTGAGPCADGTALEQASSVTVSPDGKNAYVTSQLSSAVAVFARAADGTLTQTGCVSDTGAGPCVDGAALDGAAALSVSPDGSNAYLAASGSDAVAVFARAADGTLTQTGCVSDTGAGPCDDGAALDVPRWVAVSPDGKNAYVASVFSGAVAVFDREPPPPPPTPTPTPTQPTPTPTPPPTPVERNVTPPSIEFWGRVTGASRYRCNPGSWEGLEPDARLEYAWYRLGSIIGLRGGVIRDTPTVRVATTPYYELPQADYGKKYYCEVSVQAASGQRLTAYSPTTLLTGSEETIATLQPSFYGDFRVRGIDVFQIVQPNSLAPAFGFPSGAFENFCGGGTPTSYRRLVTGFGGCTLGDRDPARTKYAGVLFDQRKPTTAIVYVDMVNASASDAAQTLDVTLSAHVNGRRLSQVITKQTSDPPVAPTPWVTDIERSDFSFGLNINVPAAWLAVAVLNGKPLDLEATVNLPVGAGFGALRECPLEVLPAGTNCASNNRFRLDGLPVFDDLPDLTIRSLPLLQNGQSETAFPTPERMLSGARKLYPGGERLNILPYQGSVSIAGVESVQMTDDRCKPFKNLRGCRSHFVEAALDGWWLGNVRNRSGYDILLGVHHYHFGPDANGNGDIDELEPGFKRGETTVSTPGEMPTIALNDLTTGNPWSPAHEFGHALGLPHADTGSNCAAMPNTNPPVQSCPGPHPDGTPDCGGNTLGQIGQAWPPDDRGLLQGVGFERTDVKLLRGSRGYRFRPDGATAYFDVMSYCRKFDGTNAWLSPRNWNRSFAVLRAVAAARRQPASASLFARAARPTEGFAIGAVGPNGARITRVTQADPDTVAPAPDPQSPLKLRALDASGTVLGEAGADVKPMEDSPGVATFVAPVPAAAAAVELVSGSIVLHRLERSRAPRVRVLALPRHARVTARGRLAVRWKASDPDGDALRATIDYAADGRSWRTVFQGPSTGRATIKGRFLDAGSRARLRVTVDDSFAQARATSTRFRADGTPPVARIVLPDVSESPQAGRVLLQGSALDDRGHRLRGRALTWFAGTNRLGTGERLLAKLPAGRITLRLRASDRGRVTYADRRLLVTPVALQLTSLRVPDRVAARASRVAVTVATTVPATVRAHGRRFRVGSRARRIPIPLPSRPRTGILERQLTLIADGAPQRRLRLTIVVLRTQ